jgi:adenylate kinase family enzyme
MIVVNLFGAPGAGKSTTTAALFSKLKLAGVNCEVVLEYAKRCVWWGREKELLDQNYVTAKQHHKLWMMQDQVDVVITDAPLLLGMLYAPSDYPLSYFEMTKYLFRQYDNVNFLINRTKEYNPSGRQQSEEESDNIRKGVIQMLTTHHEPYIEVSGGESASQIIYEHLSHQLRDKDLI